MPPRTARPRRVDRDDRRAIAALAEELATPGPAARLGKLVADQAAAALPDRSELSASAARKAAQFEREGKVLLKHVSGEVKLLDAQWKPWKSFFDVPLPAPRDLLHVFGPDEAGTRGPSVYRLAWRHDEDPAMGVRSSADVRTGKFWVEPYTVGPLLSSYAGLGVQMTPILSCFLSVRPFVNWSGFDVLSHKVYDPQFGEQRWATASAHLGIIVQSWNLQGGDPRLHARHWLELWRRSEQNPAGTRDYAGAGGPSTGLQVEVPASKNRRYAIWVCCRATVDADPGFAVATHAACGLSCHLPFLVVEELPI